jgi:hypothetical protein
VDLAEDVVHRLEIDMTRSRRAKKSQRAEGTQPCARLLDEDLERFGGPETRRHVACRPRPSINSIPFWAIRHI